MVKKKQIAPPFKQVVIAQWEGATLSYSTLALGEDGRVYRYDVGCQGWLPLPNTLVECEHRR